MVDVIYVEEFEWLKLNYPGIYFVPSKNVFQGCLWFRMSYSLSVGQGLINPDDKTNFADGFVIEDAYELTIKIDKPHSKTIVREEGGRILHTKNKWHLNLADVHMYKDGSLCLCPEPEEKMLFTNGFKLKEFFYNFLIPYFYYQSYLEKFGKEPWKSSSHGGLGILESYNKQTSLGKSLDIVTNNYIQSLPSSLANLVVSNKKINQNLLCICGSGKKFSDCHALGFDGLKKLHADYLFVKADKPTNNM